MSLASEEVTQKKDPLHNCKWVSCATAAGACMGTGAFIYATNFGKYGVLGPGCMAPGTLVVLLTIEAMIEGVYRCKHGRCIKDKDSCLLTDKDGDAKRSLRWKHCIPLQANVICIVGYIYVMTVGWELAKRSGMN